MSQYHEAFVLFDEDGSGELDTEELGNVIRSIGFQVSEAEVVDMVEESDEDRSGALDFIEFLGLNMFFYSTSRPSLSTYLYVCKIYFVLCCIYPSVFIYVAYKVFISVNIFVSLLIISITFRLFVIPSVLYFFFAPMHIHNRPFLYVSLSTELMARRFGSLMHELTEEEHNKGKETLKQALNEFDSDNSGTLSYTEYMNAVCAYVDLVYFLVVVICICIYIKYIVCFM